MKNKRWGHKTKRGGVMITKRWGHDYHEMRVIKLGYFYAFLDFNLYK